MNAWLSALALALALACTATHAAPFTPARDDEIVEKLPLLTDPQLRRVESLRRQLAARPDDVALRLDIARRYFELAMAQGDPRFVGYAEAALTPLATQAPGDARYWLLRGMVEQYNHRFEPALQSLEKAAQLDARNGEPLSWRAAIFMVQARYVEAKAECARLAPLVHPLLAAGCEAYADAATGALGPASARLQAAFDAAPTAPPALRQWVLVRLAEMAIRRQQPAEAERDFRAALALGLTDQFLLAAYGDFLLQQQRPAETLKLLDGWERSDVLLLRLALAAKATGDARAAGWAGDLRDRFAAAAARQGEQLHEQEAARAALDLQGDTPAALALARSNYTKQREPRDAEILLRSALTAGQPDAARPALDWLRDSRFEDPALAALAARLTGGGR